MKCPACGRFMKAGGRYTNDHLDSWEETWRCSLPHDDDLGSAWSTDRENGGLTGCPQSDLSYTTAPHNGMGDCPLDREIGDQQ